MLKLNHRVNFSQGGGATESKLLPLLTAFIKTKVFLGFTNANKNEKISSPLGRGWHKVSGEGFTLAEVLITLGIIGVVAAMTVPTLVAKYQEKVTVNKLKKMYSVLTQAYNMYKIDNEPEALPFTPEGGHKAFNIFKPYLKIAKDCGTSISGCFYMGMYKQLNGIDHRKYSESQNYYKVLLNDGSAIIFRGGNGNLDLEVFYDVNGETPPNAWGKDLFEFDVKNKKVVPCGMDHAAGYEEACKAPDNVGWSCTAWVIFNENLDYLH